MPQLTIIRHGQSLYNLENRFTGNVDVPLTPLGKEEAKQAGDKLKAFHFDSAFVSKLIRAQETLKIILEELNQPNLPISISEALDERMYGELQGLNKSDTIRKFGTKQVELWRRSYDVRPPGGESLKDTYERVIPYYQTQVEPELRKDKHILIVAHGNSLRALIMYLENISPEAIVEINIATGVPRVYSMDSGLRILELRDL
ncbi:MAG TPA: 2,3-bisphosphoglycerate-dependent phosphoglycerate mutase [Cytophagaceae bacterium]|nr:2,3-bisphosphoglycerate-dependent phosphoglycerate mutase [Cytophagaceae bacterium]